MEQNLNPQFSENPKEYNAILDLAQAGQYEQALAAIREYLQQNNENNVEVLNDAGAILHCLGRSEEALEYFLRAYEIKPDAIEVIWNLVEAYFALGRADEAVRFFDYMEKRSVLNVDMLNRAANIFLNQGNKGGAVEMLLRSLRICPEQNEILQPMLQVIRSKRPKIAFFCGINDIKFLEEIIEFAKQRFEVRIFNGRTEEQLFELMKWSDISWFEWCTELAVKASQYSVVCKNIVRLHRFEAYTNWPGRVKWENMDTLITIGNSHVKEALLRKIPDIERRTNIINVPNGVNLDKYEYVNRGRGKNLACVGYMNMRKNPMFLLQCMQKLHYLDREYRLFVAGNFQDEMLEQYIRYMTRQLNLEDVVLFEGWQDDINSWLKDKHYITSFSIGESQGMGLLEGMACGLKPVIHNFPGAEQIFPREYLFNISEEFCEHVVSPVFESQKYRDFVEQRYELSRQLMQINDIFTRIENQIDNRQDSSEQLSISKQICNQAAGQPCNL